ncbi:MAG: acyl-CoA thioesterase, partial [Sulfobacillus sp.]
HSHSYVVTVAIDQLTFQRPIREGMAVLLQAQVDWVGRTSLEVSVEVWSEQLLSGARELTNRAFLSFVAVDRDLRPIPVPALTLVTDQDRQAFSDAQSRRQVRLSQRKEGSK